MAAKDEAIKPGRLQTFDAWWAFLFRVICGIAGVAILIGQAFGVANPSFALTIAAGGMCGPLVAASIASFAQSMRGNSQ